MNKGLFILMAGVLMAFNACSDKRSELSVSQWDYSINFGWKFVKGDMGEAIHADFDDSDWESVDLPHDWAISGPFAPLKSYGGSGKLPWWGEGWYRKSFDLPLEADGQRLQFLFDGVMANPTVYLNGQKVGSWRYGYNSFWIDATEAAVFWRNQCAYGACRYPATWFPLVSWCRNLQKDWDEVGGSGSYPYMGYLRDYPSGI